MSKRPVIVHYHLFKNAGTSVDKILEKNFPGGQWSEVEGADNKKMQPEDLVNYIRNNPHLKAISSHTAVVTVPELEDIEILPIFFLRHPIDRIRSAYDFERKQDAKTPGAINAKAMDFNGYMGWRLSTPNPWQVSDFHAMRLKDFQTFTPAKQRHLFLPRAKESLTALPVVGLVEQFQASMERYQAYFKPYFPDFTFENVRANVTTSKKATLADNLNAFKKRIGEQSYKKLEEVNEDDFALYEIIKKEYEALLED